MKVDRRLALAFARPVLGPLRDRGRAIVPTQMKGSFVAASNAIMDAWAHFDEWSGRSPLTMEVRKMESARPAPREYHFAFDRRAQPPSGIRVSFGVRFDFSVIFGGEMAVRRTEKLESVLVRFFRSGRSVLSETIAREGHINVTANTHTHDVEMTAHETDNRNHSLLFLFHSAEPTRRAVLSLLPVVDRGALLEEPNFERDLFSGWAPELVANISMMLGMPPHGVVLAGVELAPKNHPAMLQMIFLWSESPHPDAKEAQGFVRDRRTATGPVGITLNSVRFRSGRGVPTVPLGYLAL